MLSILFVLPSCSKNSQEEMILSTPAKEVIKATVASNATYELNLDKYGTVEIYKQAQHSSYSATGIDSKSGLMLYKYMPLEEYTGEDEVILSSTKSSVYSAGNHECNSGYGEDNNSASKGVLNSISYVTIKFTVTK
jgi:hypothetical protein